jgi:hypothetical protein
LNNTPLQVEIVTHVLGSMNHCTHCQVFIDGVGVGDQVHRADLESYPPEWMEEWEQLSSLIFDLTEKFAGQLVVKITDAQSPQALWKALIHGVRKYPTFLIGGEKIQGLDGDKIENLIKQHLQISA